MSHSLPSGIASGFFPTEVIGHLRPTAQIIQWNIAAPNPSGSRHIESGAYKKTAHVANRGGFTAQMESGAAIGFGDLQIPDNGSGFTSETVALTLSMGELNKNVNSRFDRLFDNGSGTGNDNLTAFNFRMWIGNLDAFDVLAFSGVNRDQIKINPIFHFQQSAEWRQSYDLPINQSVSGVEIMPSGMPDCPNISSRESDISISGAYKDREFTNFIYIKGEFPELVSGVFYKLGTYGGLGLDTFTLKFSYDYTSLDANIIDPTDLKDFPVSETPGGVASTAFESLSGWWQFEESSPKESRLTGFTVDDGFSSAQVTMTLAEKREGGGNIGRHTGLVSSGTASGFAMDLRSDRQDQVWTDSSKPVTMMFTGDLGDGGISFTYTGWIATNDPSGVDPNVGMGLRPPWKHTGVFGRWDSGTLFHGQYRVYYNADLNRFIFSISNKFGTRPFMPYNYMNVDEQDNGNGPPGDMGTFAQIGSKEGGGGITKHRWYFIVAGYNADGEGSPGGNFFLRVNDGPIEVLPIGALTKGTISTFVDSNAPFSIGNGLTRIGGNGVIGPGAGQYDNWKLHRGKALNNREMLDLYNNGFGTEFPAPSERTIDFTILPIDDADPNPIPLRRSLRAFYNFSEPSGADRLSDSQRYFDLIQDPSGSFGMPATSGIIVDEFPDFTDQITASGALQIRKLTGGVGFRDGQPGDDGVWKTDSTQIGLFGNMDYTVAAWVRFPTALTDDPIASNWQETGNDRLWLLRKAANNDIGFLRANGTAPGDGVDTPTSFRTAFVPERWYFVYAQYEITGPSATGVLTINVVDTVTNQIFKNSVINTFQFNINSPDSSIPFVIGGYNLNSGRVTGDLDIAAFGLWYRKLPQKEIDLLVNSGRGLNFGASNFDKIPRIYWDSQLKRDNDPSTV